MSSLIQRTESEGLFSRAAHDGTIVHGKIHNTLGIVAFNLIYAGHIIAEAILPKPAALQTGYVEQDYLGRDPD